MLVSVPNVQFWPVVWRLLRGHWTYAPHGVLDVGHLRFFTVRSARELVRGSGLEIVRVHRRYRLWEPRGDRTTPPAVAAAAKRVGPTERLRRLGFFRVFFFLRDAFTYQTVVLGRKPAERVEAGRGD